MKDLYTTVSEEGYEDTTVGEDIIETFYNGNFTDGIKQLIKINVTPREFGDYINQLSEDLGYENSLEFASGHFDYDFWISIGQEYYTIARSL